MATYVHASIIKKGFDEPKQDRYELWLWGGKEYIKLEDHGECSLILLTGNKKPDVIKGDLSIGVPLNSSEAIKVLTSELQRA
jgi:hypothetical protein